MEPCPMCGCLPRSTSGSRPASIATQLASIAPGEERVIRRAASRWYMHKLRARHPDLVWRQERVSLIGGRNGMWDVYAARPTVLS